MTLAFFLSLINDIGSIGGLIMAFKQIDYTWSQIVSWFIDLGVSIAIFVLSLLALIRISSSTEANPTRAMNKNCLCIAIYEAAAIFAEILIIIHASTLGTTINSGLPLTIMLVIFQLICVVSLFTSLAKFENPLISKVLRYVGYGTWFVCLILTISNGTPTGMLLVFFIFLFFVNIVGLAQVIICSLEVKESVKNETKLNEQNPSANAETTISEEPIKEENLNYEKRLLNLNNLHAQGLISDEEYNEKRQKIIDSL